MKIFIALLTSLMLLGCGDHVTDAKDNTDGLLVGLWDSIQNNKTVCHNRLRLNSDKTFWWFSGGQGDLGVGTYGRSADGLNFEFTDQPWEIMKFTVTDRELTLSRMGDAFLFTRVPLSATYSPCPGNKKPLPPKQK